MGNDTKLTGILGGLADSASKREKKPASSYAHRAFDGSNLFILNSEGEFFSEGKAAPGNVGAKFLNAWVTNTRLMGVFCVYIEWTFESGKHQGKELHQMYYFDVSEYGFNRYDEILDSGTPEDNIKLRHMVNSFIGGLGGICKKVTLPQAAAIIAKYRRFNLMHDIDFPEEFVNRKIKLNPLAYVPMTRKRRMNALKSGLTKACKNLDCNTERANYFLMRYCDCDREGMGMLCKDFDAGSEFSENGIGVCSFPSGTDTAKLCEHELLTLFSNEVEWLDKDGTEAKCKSIAGLDEGGFSNDYQFIVSKIKFDSDGNVEDFEIISKSPLSDQEAYMNLAHEEYVVTLHYDGDVKDFNVDTSPLLEFAMEIEEIKGRSFMIYHSDNEHIKSSHYKIYEDLLGIYYMDDSGELIASAFSEKGIQMLEWDILKLPEFKEEKLKFTGRFRFADATVGAYIHSDFPSFQEFITHFFGE